MGTVCSHWAKQFIDFSQEGEGDHALTLITTDGKTEILFSLQLVQHVEFPSSVLASCPWRALNNVFEML